MSGLTPNNYLHIITELKNKIKQAKINAALSVNRELLAVYWEIGNTILQQQKAEGWGAKIIDRLSLDLKNEFPEMKGLSVRNIKYMRAFAEAYPNFPIVQPALAQIHNSQNQLDTIVQVSLAQLTWYHHITLLDKVKEPELRLFYLIKAVENGWTRDMMVNQFEGGLHNRQGSLTTNFKTTLPEYQSELTQQLFKDPYNFDFLSLGTEAKERDLENALMNHIQKLLPELGQGFAFMGKQYHLEAGEQDYFLDLLFYHTKLRRHIVIDLKIGDFKPEYAGKMNFYLSLTDDKLKGEYDEAAIGLILCKTKNKIVAEYALRDTSKPIGIAEYKINQLLPEDIKSELPSIEEIEQKLDEEIVQNQSPVDARLKTIKEKLRNIKSEEIQTPVTYDLLQNLFQEGLKPLYQQIIEKMMTEFQEAFLTQEVSWTLNNKIEYGIDAVEAFFKDEKNYVPQRIDFSYKLEGFRKSGTHSYNENFSILLLMDKYYYSFRINNYNGSDVVKKLYHQPFTQVDINLILDALVMLVLDRIEWMIEQINNENKIGN